MMLIEEERVSVRDHRDCPQTTGEKSYELMRSRVIYNRSFGR